MGRRIKYMGSADERVIASGEDWGGRLGKPIEAAISFNKGNGRIVDVEAAGLTEGAITLLLEDPSFVDVTGADLIPAGLNEQLFHGIPESPFMSRADGQGNEIYRTPVYTPPTESYEDLTVDEMQARLQELGLPKSGNKEELKKRLEKASTPPPVTPPTTSGAPTVTQQDKR